jgi:hypothetical protein
VAKCRVSDIVVVGSPTCSYNWALNCWLSDN